eukprot:14179999-Alexandrium_andersonii.AAC.1
MLGPAKLAIRSIARAMRSLLHDGDEWHAEWLSRQVVLVLGRRRTVERRCQVRQLLRETSWSEAVQLLSGPLAPARVSLRGAKFVDARLD